MLHKLVAYVRVSTDKQGRSGLGLEAQQAAVTTFAEAHGGEIVARFVEVESGKRNDRPELGNALAACRKHKATLVIAKLDRLARNVAFIATGDPLLLEDREIAACTVRDAAFAGSADAVSSGNSGAVFAGFNFSV